VAVINNYTNEQFTFELPVHHPMSV